MTTPNTILGAFQPRTRTAQAVSALLTVLAGTIVLALSAKVSIPVQPVPVTLQTMAVAGLAAAFGWRIGVATVLAYIVEGLAGLPVFANGGGIAYLASPTFGFIIGYLPMAYIIGRASDLGASQRSLPLIGVMLVADAVCFAFGFAWLLAMAGGAAWIDQSNILASAFAKAVQPFILWDAIKMVFAALTVTGLWAVMSPKR